MKYRIILLLGGAVLTCACAKGSADDDDDDEKSAKPPFASNGSATITGDWEMDVRTAIALLNEYDSSNELELIFLEVERNCAEFFEDPYDFMPGGLGIDASRSHSEGELTLDTSISIVDCEVPFGTTPENCTDGHLDALPYPALFGPSEYWYAGSLTTEGRDGDFIDGTFELTNGWMSDMWELGDLSGTFHARICVEE